MDVLAARDNIEELEEAIDITLQEQLYTDARDGSLRQVSRSLLGIYELCARGELDKVNAVLRRMANSNVSRMARYKISGMLLQSRLSHCCA